MWQLWRTKGEVMTFTLDPPGYRNVGLEHWYQAESGKFDPIGAAMADRHYSRRTVGAPQFMPPGQTIVLIAKDMSAVWGWWRPHPSSGIELMSGLSGWTCCIFRNEGQTKSSELILDAEEALLGLTCGETGMITYVWCDRVRSTNPGYCYQLAGWEKTGWSADGKKRLLTKPHHRAGMRPGVPDRQCWECYLPLHVCGGHPFPLNDGSAAVFFSESYTPCK